jgi:hypothetical protein
MIKNTANKRMMKNTYLSIQLDCFKKICTTYLRSQIKHQRIHVFLENNFFVETSLHVNFTLKNG